MSATYDAPTDAAKRAAYPMPLGVGTFLTMIRPTTDWRTDGADRLIAGQDDGSGSVFWAINKWTDNNWYVGWFYFAEFRIIFSAAAAGLLVNQWNSVLYEFDTDAAHSGAGAVQNFEINGVVVGTRAGTFTTPDMSAQALILGNGRNNNEDIRGELAKSAIYARRLTATEKAFARSGGMPSGALSHWPLASDLNDVSGGARHLTNTGITFPNPNPPGPTRAINGGPLRLGPLRAAGLGIKRG